MANVWNPQEATVETLINRVKLPGLTKADLVPKEVKREILKSTCDQLKIEYIATGKKGPVKRDYIEAIIAWVSFQYLHEVSLTTPQNKTLAIVNGDALNLEGDAPTVNATRKSKRMPESGGGVMSAYMDNGKRHEALGESIVEVVATTVAVLNKQVDQPQALTNADQPKEKGKSYGFVL